MGIDKVVLAELKPPDTQHDDTPPEGDHLAPQHGDHTGSGGCGNHWRYLS